MTTRVIPPNRLDVIRQCAAWLEAGCPSLGLNLDADAKRRIVIDWHRDMGGDPAANLDGLDLPALAARVAELTRSVERGLVDEHGIQPRGSL